MFTYLQDDYTTLTDDELLQLASDRDSLTDGAQSALDNEIRNRNLTPSDLAKHVNLVNRSDQRETRRRNRKLFGTRRTRRDWVETAVAFFWMLVVMALISAEYLALPSRYRFSNNWQEAALYVMFSSVFLAVISAELRPKVRFWIALLISSTIHLFLVHAWIVRIGSIDWRSHWFDRRLAILFGPVLFLIVYGCGFQLRKKFYGEEAGVEVDSER